MQKIPLKLAAKGMVLARDVFRNDTPVGMPICGKKTVLTDALITRFENLDVNAIYVEGHPVPDENQRSLEDMLRELERRFDKVKSDPLMAKLYDLHAKRLKQSMGDNGGRQAE